MNTEKQPLTMAQECSDFATSLRSAANMVRLEGREPPVSFLRAADLCERAAKHIATLETQLEAVVAGGVQPLQQSAPEHSGPLRDADAVHGKTLSVYATAPQRIFLDVGEDCPADAAFEELYAVTWSGNDALGNGIEYVRKDLATRPAQCLQQSAEDARDAALYRSLRRGQHWSVIDGIGGILRGDDLDAAIAAQADKGGAA